MWQKCPVCSGSGSIGIGFPYGETCSVCNGGKIINSITGQPAFEVVTTTGNNLNIGKLWNPNLMKDKK